MEMEIDMSQYKEGLPLPNALLGVILLPVLPSSCPGPVTTDIQHSPFIWVRSRRLTWEARIMRKEDIRRLLIITRKRWTKFFKRQAAV